MAKVEWLLFLAQLPATPSSLRVNVWRRLRDAGSTSLQNGVWALPRNAENTIFMQRLLLYVKQNGASSQIFLAQGLDQAINEDILARFKTDRDQEYDEFLEQCEALTTELEKESLHQKFTFAELEENEQNLLRLRKWMVKIQKRDFIGGEKAQTATKALEKCQTAFEAFSIEVYNRHTSLSSPNTDFEGE